MILHNNFSGTPPKTRPEIKIHWNIPVTRKNIKDNKKNGVFMSLR
jgi:hypothetical protein